MVDVGGTPASEHITAAAEHLNLMIKAWHLDDIKLWLNEQIVVYLAYDTESYTLGPTGDHAALLSDTVKTQLSADIASGTSTLTVDSITGIADGDYAGIELDDGTIQWSTVNGSPSGSTVELDDNLTDDAATDNWLFFHTNYITRPFKILDAYLRDTDDIDEPITIVNHRREYFEINEKDATGATTLIYYEPIITDGRLYTWPVASAGEITDRLILTIQRTIEDFDSSANNFDGPSETLNALVWNLAAELTTIYPTSREATILAKAKVLRDQLQSHYGSNEAVYLRPEW
jgi:hypothetical protein